jgi:uncharacterized membrane protein YiaA
MRTSRPGSYVLRMETQMMQNATARPTNAFVGASWAALLVGTVAYLVGLWNAQMAPSEKGYYLTILMFGLFSAVSLQKSVRDRMEGIAVSPIYFGLAWVSVGASLLLLTVGLWNAALLPSEKGFYAMSFTLSRSSAVTVQKNVRDLLGAEPGRSDERSRVVTESGNEAPGG